MHVLQLSIYFLVGYFAGYFLLIRPLLLLYFNLPAIKAFSGSESKRDFKRAGRFAASVIIPPLLFWAITKGAMAWGPQGMNGYWIGLVVAVSSGVSRLLFV